MSDEKCLLCGGELMSGLYHRNCAIKRINHLERQLSTLGDAARNYLDDDSPPADSSGKASRRRLCSALGKHRR